jgi:hypothetical protein
MEEDAIGWPGGGAHGAPSIVTPITSEELLACAAEAHTSPGCEEARNGRPTRSTYA